MGDKNKNKKKKPKKQTLTFHEKKILKQAEEKDKNILKEGKFNHK